MGSKRMGQKEAPFYRVVVADPRSLRDGKFVEEVGTYDPTEEPGAIKFGKEAVRKRLVTGVQPIETVGGLLKIAGIQ